ncbi:MAG: S1C family serine protease [Acidimicrobiia bacterium]
MDQDRPDGDQDRTAAQSSPTEPDGSSTWSPDHIVPPFVGAAPPPPAASAGREPSQTRIGVVALVSALIGALVGGGIAGGVVVAVDGHGSTTVVTSSLGDGTVAARPSTVLSKSGDIRAILAKVEPAVVRIDVTAYPDTIKQRSGTGTGFIIASNGIIVTNAHVANAETAAAAAQLVVTLGDGTSAVGHVVGEDRTADLAVVKINRTGLPTVQLGDSDTLQVGDAVVAIGNALGIAGSPTVTSGIVSGLDRTVNIAGTETLVDAIQTDAAINPGNSGGPLVDVDGQVIGINTAIADPGSANNIGFAISISSAEPLLDALRDGKTPRIAYMGVSTQTVTPNLVVLRHLRTAVGAYVAVVAPGSGAARAKLRTGDVIVELDGERVTSNDDVVRIVREHRPGDSIQVVVLRATARKTFEVTLGDLPNA